MAEPNTSTTSAEEVGHAMQQYVLMTYGRVPTQIEFEQIYWAWSEKVEEIYDR